MTRNTPAIPHTDALMSLMRDQGLLHSAEGASDGSWLVRRTARGPRFVLETPLEALEYAMDVLLDVRLELEAAA
ncbi:hypothetical protein ABZW30_08005 [Kitasatospora sp. NPDC004669]|uniref:hypothetical protein n=1 Tax=Kitasatospora sp. NPDC004669 TaxID=3154555 RepID=UPI0033AE2FDA